MVSSIGGLINSRLVPPKGFLPFLRWSRRGPMAFSSLDRGALCSTSLAPHLAPYWTPIPCYPSKADCLTVSSSDDPDARYTDHLDHSYSALHRLARAFRRR